MATYLNDTDILYFFAHTYTVSLHHVLVQAMTYVFSNSLENGWTFPYGATKLNTLQRNDQPWFVALTVSSYSD